MTHDLDYSAAAYLGRLRPGHDNNLYGPGGSISDRARYIIPTAPAC